MCGHIHQVSGCSGPHLEVACIIFIKTGLHVSSVSQTVITIQVWITCVQGKKMINCSLNICTKEDLHYVFSPHLDICPKPRVRSF